METKTSHAARRGFTLTELLVVITIIALLAALATVGVMAGLTASKQGRIKLEIGNLDMALKAYKEKYGSYPPCDMRSSNNAAIQAHVARVFPRYNVIDHLTNDLLDTGVERDPMGPLRPDQALVFWLKGFGPDPTHPFLTVDGFQIENGTITATRHTPAPLYEFDKTRLAQIPFVSGTTVVSSYFPPGIKTDTSGAPYLYWEPGPATITGTAPNTTTTTTYGIKAITATTTVMLTPRQFNDSGARIFLSAGTASPYWHDVTTPATADTTENWANPESFQIIAAGLDAKYSSDNIADEARFYPTGTNYDTDNLADDDNVTNFSRGSRLENDKP